MVGHGSSDSITFRQTREGELNFVEDLDINLGSIATSNHPPHSLGDTTVKGQLSFVFMKLFVICCIT